MVSEGQQAICAFSITDLTWFLPVCAVGDIEEDFEDLYDALWGFQWDGECIWAQHTLILVLPLNLQAVFQSCSENGDPSLLAEPHDVCGKGEEIKKILHCLNYTV